MKPRKWTTIESDHVYQTPIFDLLRHQREHPHRGRHHFYVLSAPNWINIIPLTPSQEVVMVHQFRHGIEDHTLEVPGGMVDPGEEPGVAARREMIEESGYDSDNIVAIGKVHPNPAIQGNYCFSFFARDVRLIGKPPQHTGAEETEVVTVPLADIRKMIATGEITHALTITAFSFLQFYNSALF